MSFLLGRSQHQQQQQPGYAAASGSNSVLYDASSDAGDDNDDELEAAFGDSDARELDNRADYRRQVSDTQYGASQQHGIPVNPYRPEGHSHAGEESINMDDNDSENDHLLHSSSTGHHGNRSTGGGSSDHLQRPRMATAQTSSSSHTSNSNPGGYDFEADPYERRSAPISLGADDDDDDDNALPSRRRQDRSRNGHSASNTGLLATLRNILPSRFRQYGVLGADSRTASGRRTDGTIDHGDDDDEDNEAWIAPPPSMPGVYGGGLSNDGVFANMAAKPGNSRSGDRSDIVGGDDEAAEKEIPPVCADSAGCYRDSVLTLCIVDRHTSSQF